MNAACYFMFIIVVQVQIFCKESATNLEGPLVFILHAVLAASSEYDVRVKHGRYSCRVTIVTCCDTLYH